MQELLLFGQVPLARHDYVLSVLAGIAAMQPKPILEKHLLFKPSRPLASVRASSAIAAVRQQGVSTSSLLQVPPGDLFYLKVVIDINHPTRSGPVAGPGAGTRAGAGAGTANFAVERNNGLASNNKDGVSCSSFIYACLPFLFYNPVVQNNKIQYKTNPPPSRYPIPTSSALLQANQEISPLRNGHFNFAICQR